MSFFNRIFCKKNPEDRKDLREYQNMSKYLNYGKNPIECLLEPANHDPIVFETDEGFTVLEQMAMLALTDEELYGEAALPSKTDRRIFAILLHEKKPVIFEIKDDENGFELEGITDWGLCCKILKYAEAENSKNETIREKIADDDSVSSPADAVRGFVRKYGREALRNRTLLHDYLLKTQKNLTDPENHTQSTDFYLFLRGADYGICSAYLRAVERIEKMNVEQAKEGEQSAKETELEFCRIENKLCSGLGIQYKDAEKITNWMKSAFGL